MRSRPPKRYFSRQYLLPFGWTRMNIPSPSVSLYGLSRGLALRIFASERGMGYISPEGDISWIVVSPIMPDVNGWRADVVGHSIPLIGFEPSSVGLWRTLADDSWLRGQDSPSPSNNLLNKDYYTPRFSLSPQLCPRFFAWIPPRQAAICE